MRCTSITDFRTVAHRPYRSDVKLCVHAKYVGVRLHEGHEYTICSSVSIA